MGAELRLDAAYAVAVMNRGGDLTHYTPARLAMCPQRLADAAEARWQADESGLFFGLTYVDTRVVWPADVEFRYSDMLFVGSTGTLWTAAHTEPIMGSEVFDELEPWRVWMEAARDPFTIRPKAGFESTDAPAAAHEVPELVRDWLNRHPMSETMRSSG